MLKIKDNIDLEVLKNYGFVFDNKNNKYKKESEDWNEIIGINAESRLIYIEYIGNTFSIVEDTTLNDLYNLIKSNLVEESE